MIKNSIGQKFYILNIKLLLIMAVLIVFFTINMQYNLVSISFAFTFVILIVYFVSTIIPGRINRSEAIDYFLLFSIIMLAFASTISSSMSFDYLKKFLMFCSTLIFLLLVNNVHINKKLVDFIFKINLIIAIIYIYFVYLVKIEYSQIGLTLNFINPNLTAMWIFHTILFLFIASAFYKKISFKIFYFIVACVLIYPMILTRSRAVLIALVCFLILFLYIFLKKNIKLNKFIIIFTVLIPLIFVGVYLYLLNNSNLTAFDFLVSEGKSIESRETVWLLALDYIKSNWFLGAYDIIPHQMHNTHLDTLASYGVIVLILMMIFISNILLKINKQCNSKFQTICILAFLSIIILGTFEAALFSGGTGLYILSISFLLLARYETE